MKKEGQGYYTTHANNYSTHANNYSTLYAITSQANFNYGLNTNIPPLGNHTLLGSQQ